MPIDPSIPLAYRPPAIAPLEVQSPLDRYTKMISLKNLMTEQAAGELGLQAKQFAFNEAQQAAQKSDQLGALFAKGTPTSSEVLAIDPVRFTPVVKAMGELVQQGYKNDAERFKLLGNIAGLAYDVPSAKAAIEHAVSVRAFDTDPVKNAQIGAQQLDHLKTAGFDPQLWQSFGRAAMEASAREEAAQKAKEAPFKLSKAEADAAEAKVKAEVAKRQNNAINLEFAMAKGPEAFQAELAKLPEADRAPFLGATTPQDVRNRGLTAHEQVLAEQAAATAAQTAKQHAAQNRIAQENLAIRRKKDAREEAAYQQTYGANANQALVGVDPKLRVQVAGKADKAFQDHAKAVSAADDMQAFLELAKSGNKEAYAYLSPEGVLTLNTGRGVTRVNRQEIEAYAGAGSWGDILKGKIGKALTGASISPDVIKDIEALHQRISQNADKNYQTTLDGLNQNYKSNYTFAGKRAGEKTNPNPGGYTVGHVYGGKKYLGGDWRKPESWQ